MKEETKDRIQTILIAGAFIALMAMALIFGTPIGLVIFGGNK